jgi:hypothetical protein
MRIRWLHVGASFNTRREADPGAPDRILYSLDPDAGWTLVREETPPDWDEHWYYNLEAELVLDSPAEEVWLRLEPATAANALRAYAHCAPDGEPEPQPVLVTHTYRVEGELTTRSFEFRGPASYQIECAGDPENVSVRMAVPSRPAG